MANGDAVKVNGVNSHSRNPGSGYRVEKYLLIDGEEDATTASQVEAWVNVAGAKRAGINIIGEDDAGATQAVGTVQIRGFYSPVGTAPAVTELGFQIGSDKALTDNGSNDFAPLGAAQTLEWVAARISAYTSGKFTVVLVVEY